MFATARLPVLLCSFVAKFMPLTVALTAQLPDELQTLIERIVTPLATPNVAPPTVPATWLPWLLQSLLPGELQNSEPTKSAAIEARPPNSTCVERMPVSITYAVTPEPVALNTY